MAHLLFPLLNEMELEELVLLENVKIELLRQDFTRKYHEQVAELEFAFRQRLYQLHLHAMSQHEVNPSKKIQQGSSRPVDLGLPEQTGWCSLCKVHCNTENDLQKHIVGKKHQCMFEKWKQGSRDGRQGNLMQQKTQDKQSQQEKDIADNHDKRKNQIKEGGILSNKLQKDNSSSIDSKLPEGLGWCPVCEVDCNTGKVLKRGILGKKHQSKIKVFKQDSGSKPIDSKLPERPGWCSLCEIDCNTKNVLKRHIMGKKHQSVIKMLEQGSGDGKEANSKQQKSQADQQQQERDVIQINNLDKREKQMKEGGMCTMEMQQDGSTSLVSGEAEQSGWCSLCEVNCNTEKALEQHILANKHQKKHRSVIKMLEQGSGDGRESNSKQQKPQAEQQQQERDVINNLDKREKQMEEGGMCTAKMQQDGSTSLVSGLAERLGWCSLCEVNCNSEKGLEQHILAKKHQKKHQSVIKMLEQGSRDGKEANSKQQKSQAEQQQQERDVINNLDEREKKMTKGGMCTTKMQQDGSTSLVLGLAERSGWCSLCEVNCNTEKGLEQHILAKKHQSVIKLLELGSGDGKEGNSKQQKSQAEQEEERDVINNLDRREKQMKEGSMCTTKMQQDGLTSLVLGLAGRSGWCSSCEVNCNTEKGLQQHILEKDQKKHQSMIKMLEQGSGDGKEANSKQQKSQVEQEEEERDVINNLDKREKQMEEGGMCTAKMQQDGSTSLVSGLAERLGWCSLCEVNCNSEKGLEQHILAKKHQSVIKMLDQGSGDGKEANSKQQKSQAEQQQQERDVINNLDKREKKMTKGSMCTTKMQQDDSTSLVLGLAERSGWCSLCEVNCNTEKGLVQHILAKKHQKKHQSVIKLLEQGSGDGIEANSKQQKSQAEQEEERDVINNLDRREKQMKEGSMCTTKMQQDGLTSLVLGLAGRLGWCSLCEVNCNTEKGLEQHILAKKHQKKYQSVIKMLEQGSGDGKEANPKQQKSQAEQQEEERDVINNLDKRENQMKEGSMCTTKMQQDGSTSLVSGLAERSGWCSLCEVNCNTEKGLEQHILAKKHQKKHQSMIKMLEQGSGDGKEANSKQQKSQAEQQQQDRDVINNLDQREKQMEEGSVCTTKMQQDGSTSRVSGLAEQSGRCSLCEVNCNTEKGLEQHILANKHQLMLKKVGQGLAGGREEDSKQQKSLTEQKQQDRDIIDNLPKQEKQIRNEDIPSKHFQNDSSRSLESGFPERPGWCTLC